MERLQKILAQAGLASRRAAEAMILAGRVAVDGEVVTSLGSKADLQCQKVTLDGVAVGRRPEYHYWIAHKPAGLLSTRFDPQNRPTVMSLLPPHLREMLYPVGRLDMDSEGLMLLTNDGELAYRLMHPRFKVAKHYKAWVAGQPGEESLERLRQGIFIEGKKTAPAQVELLRSGIYRSQLSLVLVEGRKREIRLMGQAIGHPVLHLVRWQLGSISLGSLDKGKARVLNKSEIKLLRASAGLADGALNTPARPKRGKGRPLARPAAPQKPHDHNRARPGRTKRAKNT